MILLWMGGGMAQTDTFDPKRYIPYESGLRSADVIEHLSGDRHRRGWSEALAGSGEHCEGDGPRNDCAHRRSRPIWAEFFIAVTSSIGTPDTSLRRA